MKDKRNKWEDGRQRKKEKHEVEKVSRPNKTIFSNGSDCSKCDLTNFIAKKI